MLIQNGQIAFIVYDLRQTNLSPKDQKVQKLFALLKSAVRQAEIVDKENYLEIEEKVHKILNNRKAVEIKKNSLADLLGSRVQSGDMSNYYQGTYGRDLCKSDWQQVLAKGIKGATDGLHRVQEASKV